MVQSGTIWDNLDDKQIAAINCQIINPGYTYADISRELGIPEQTIRNWRIKALAKEVQKDITKSIQDYIEHVSFDAIRVLAGQLRSSDERIAQTAANKILEWTLGKPVQRSELTGKDGAAIETENIVKIVDYRQTASLLLTDVDKDVD